MIVKRFGTRVPIVIIIELDWPDAASTRPTTCPNYGTAGKVRRRVFEGGRLGGERVSQKLFEA